MLNGVTESPYRDPYVVASVLCGFSRKHRVLPRSILVGPRTISLPAYIFCVFFCFCLQVAFDESCSLSTTFFSVFYDFFFRLEALL